MNRCWEVVAIAFILGAMAIGVARWLVGRERRRAREAKGWQYFIHGVMQITIKTADMQDIRRAVAALREEQGFSPEWEDRFTSVIRSRMRPEAKLPLEYAIFCLRMELEGY
jgi:hypothetical protein